MVPRSLHRRFLYSLSQLFGTSDVVDEIPGLDRKQRYKLETESSQPILKSSGLKAVIITVREGGGPNWNPTGRSLHSYYAIPLLTRKAPRKPIIQVPLQTGVQCLLCTSLRRARRYNTYGFLVHPATVPTVPGAPQNAATKVATGTTWVLVLISRWLTILILCSCALASVYALAESVSRTTVGERSGNLKYTGGNWTGNYIHDPRRAFQCTSTRLIWLQFTTHQSLAHSWSY